MMDLGNELSSTPMLSRSRSLPLSPDDGVLLTAAASAPAEPAVAAPIPSSEGEDTFVDGMLLPVCVNCSWFPRSDFLGGIEL